VLAGVGRRAFGDGDVAGATNGFGLCIRVDRCTGVMFILFFVCKEPGCGKARARLDARDLAFSSCEDT